MSLTCIHRRRDAPDIEDRKVAEELRAFDERVLARERMHLHPG